ncbi:MAG: hypothetical protein K1X44_01575 [Alphaproteobacteria bacterium]|nr:hypothetical protein [Alphaproteobacteria bacterium]
MNKFGYINDNYLNDSSIIIYTTQSNLSNQIVNYKNKNFFLHNKEYGQNIMDHDKYYDRNCFTSGTLISMADDTKKPIEQVKIGDRVYAYQGIVDNPVAKRVSNTSIKDEQIVYQLTTVDGRVVKATGDHLFLVGPIKTNMMLEKIPVLYKSLKDLTVKDRLVGQIGSIILIQEIVKLPEIARVYNLTVEDYHTYIAAGIRVHNCNPMTTDLGL